MGLRHTTFYGIYAVGGEGIASAEYTALSSLAINYNESRKQF